MAITLQIPVLSSTLSSALWGSASMPPTWGIYQLANGQSTKVLNPDSFLEFSVHPTYETPNFPVQAGSFAQYNKVFRSKLIRVRVSKGGTVSDRTTLITTLNGMLASTAANYAILIPEGYYPGYDMYEYEITRRGPTAAYFLYEVDLYFKLINQVTAQYTNTAVNLSNAQSASAQPTANSGSQQPQTPSTAQSSTMTAALAATPGDTY